MKLTSYLIFNGNAEVVAQHYAKIFNAEFERLHYYGENIPDLPEEYKTKVLHLCITFNGCSIGMADSTPDKPSTFGSGNVITVNCDTEEQIKAIYEGLSPEAKSITCPLQPTFFAKQYGELVDCFGVSWAFILE